MRFSLSMIFGSLILSVCLSTQTSAQPINEAWIGTWESTELRPVFNEKNRREEQKTERLEITTRHFDNCVWSTKAHGVVTQEMDCHASYTDVKTLAQLTADFGSSKFARHLRSLSAEKPFRIILQYTPAGSGDCARFFIWDRGAVYGFSTQCPVQEDTRRIVKYTKVGAPTSAGVLKNTSMQEYEGAFRAAGFKPFRGQWRKCEDDSPSYNAGRITEKVDLNGDSRPELIIVEHSASCYGRSAAAFSVVTQSQSGSWVPLATDTVGIYRILGTKSPAGWLDIEIGGPGFCFPILRHDGQKYTVHRREYNGKACGG